MTDPFLPMPPVTSADPASRVGKARLEPGHRNQIEMRLASLDELLPPDHRARVVWEMVEMMDLTQFYARIGSVEGEAGRPAIDPQMLIGVWLYATLEGVGSARAVARLCEEHLAYRWLMGGIAVNYHTLADFRVGYEAELDDLLTKGVTALLEAGLVSLDQVAQDGLRVRAAAGGHSFRQRETLQAHLNQAEAYVQQLKQETSQDTESTSPRQQAARQRAAKERVDRLKKALQEIDTIEKQRRHSHKKKGTQKPAQCSETDPEARYLELPAGELRPAYNAQLSIDTASRIIVGTDLINLQDGGQMDPMVEQLAQKYDRTPREYLVDGSFASFDDLQAAHDKHVTVYAPLPKPRTEGADPAQVRPTDTPGVQAWRERMGMPEAKEIYKQRAATIEWANALARLHGFVQVRVRGLQKVHAVLLWMALAHNVMQAFQLLKRQAVLGS
jgi:transposase